ncbi:MAG: type II toxin-antitoxin system MqsA family antitoxin [Candidatus Sedimenticola sp. (ex Thyasira tokunagai)]
MEKTKKGLCPMCGEGVLAPAVRNENITLKGDGQVGVEFQYSVCDVCASEVTTPKQAKANQLKVRDAQRAHDGLMTSDEILSVRKRYQLSQADAASIYGGGTNSFSKYERGEVIQSVAMDRLIRISNEFPVVFVRLAEMASCKVVLSRSVRFKSASMLTTTYEYFRQPVGSPAQVIPFAAKACANQDWIDDKEHCAGIACNG